jgi:hypothetical protein
MPKKSEEGSPREDTAVARAPGGHHQAAAEALGSGCSFVGRLSYKTKKDSGTKTKEPEVHGEKP